MADDELIAGALESATDTKAVRIGDGVLGDTGSVVADVLGDREVVVVADATTWEVAGQDVQDALASAGVATRKPFVYPDDGELYAKYENIELLVSSLREHDACPVAIGSGTLNDLVKRSSEEVGRPYVVVGTAASMDGYTSFGASIAKDGHKQTLECSAPAAAILDMRLLVDAPQRLTASGYGDLIGKVPSGADWIIADELGLDPIDDEVWERVQGPLDDAVGNPKGLRDGDREAMGQLVTGLVMSGLAMQAHQSSRPASGAEHQFSHLWEMEGHGVDQTPRLSHGFKVGLGTIAVAALYERVLQRDLSAIDVDACVAAWPSREEMEQKVRADHDVILDVALSQTMEKYIEADELRARLELLADRWPTIAERVRAQVRTPAELTEMIGAVGGPTHPEHIGLGFEAFRESYRRAQMIRSRFTILDVVTETDMLEELVDELFSPGGFWAEQQA